LAFRGVQPNCVVCDEPIDDFHERWQFVDGRLELRVHIECAVIWNDIVALLDDD
jgi:hypothetical protein